MRKRSHRHVDMTNLGKMTEGFMADDGRNPHLKSLIKVRLKLRYKIEKQQNQNLIELLILYMHSIL